MSDQQKICRECGKLFTPFYNRLQSVCSPKCAISESKKKAKVKSKRKKYPHIYTSELKQDLQKAINEIVRLIDKGAGCIDCDRKESKPYWNAGHFNSVGSNETLRYHLHNIHNQTLFCNLYGQVSKERYLEGVEKKYGKPYSVFLASLSAAIPLANIDTQMMPRYVKKARKAVRELKKLGLKYTSEERIKLRDKINNEIGIYKQTGK